jgi:hypothetical protein
MTQDELYKKLWKSDQTEWDVRVKQCTGCNGTKCQSPFMGYVLEMSYSRDSERTKLFNVPCKYHNKINNLSKDNDNIHNYPNNITVN